MILHAQDVTLEFKDLPQEHIDALSYIFIGQRVRAVKREEQGEGVLEDDCDRYKDYVPDLLRSRLVESYNWNKLRVCRTTAKGERFAKQIIQQRLSSFEPELVSILDRIPLNLAAYFWKEALTKGFVYPGVKGFSDRDFCLVEIDETIKDEWNLLIRKLNHNGLVVEAHYYVSSKNDKVRSLRYVWPIAITDFIEEYLLKKGVKINSPLFPKKLDDFHRLYHKLEPSNCKNVWDMALEEKLEAELNSIPVKDIFYEIRCALEKREAVKIKAAAVYIIEPVVVVEELRKKLLTPLVNFLLSDERNSDFGCINCINTNENKKLPAVDKLKQLNQPKSNDAML
jgi:hypothetical protein